MVGGDHSYIGRGRHSIAGGGRGWGGGHTSPGGWAWGVGGVGTGAGLAQEAAVEDAGHVGLVEGPDDEQGDEECCDSPKGDPEAGVVEGQPFGSLIDVCPMSPVAVAAYGSCPVVPWARATALSAAAAAPWAAAEASGSVFST